MVTQARILFPRLFQAQQPTGIPWLSGVHTKLAADGLDVTGPVLLLLCQGIDFYYRSEGAGGCWNLSGKSPQLLWNLSATLGLYLEDFHTQQVERLKADLHRNLTMRWLPMLELSSRWLGIDGETAFPDEVPDLILPVVGYDHDQETLIVIHPLRPEHVALPISHLESASRQPSILPRREGKYGWRWLMLNSPSLSSPVFPPLRQGLRSALQVWAHRFLYMPDLPDSCGLTGRQAFTACTQDLRRLAAEGEGRPDLAQRLEAVIRGEFGNAWGRDVQAAGIREIAPILGADLEVVSSLFERSAVLWAAWSLAVGNQTWDFAADVLDEIAALELQAAVTLESGLSISGAF